MKRRFVKMLIGCVSITMLCVTFLGCSGSGIETEINSERPIEITQEEKQLEVTLKGEELIKVKQGEKFIDPGVSVNKKAIVTTKTLLDVNKPGMYDVIYTAKCEDGDLETITRKVEVIEYKLKLTLNGEQKMLIKKGETFVDPGYTVNKNAKVITKTHLNVDKPGIYEICYTAENAQGQIDSVIRVVEVR